MSAILHRRAPDCTTQGIALSGPFSTTVCRRDRWVANPRRHDNPMGAPQACTTARVIGVYETAMKRVGAGNLDTLVASSRVGLYFELLGPSAGPLSGRPTPRKLIHADCESARLRLGPHSRSTARMRAVPSRRSCQIATDGIKSGPRRRSGSGPMRRGVRRVFLTALGRSRSPGPSRR